MTAFSVHKQQLDRIESYFKRNGRLPEGWAMKYCFNYLLFKMGS